QTSGLGRSIAWTSYNKPASISQGARTISFLDGPDHQRFKQVTPEGTTLYFAAFGAVSELAVSANSRWTDYLSVGNVAVGARFHNINAETVSTRYFHTDHLGSIAAITDENGGLVERLSYDAWGKRRVFNGQDDPTGSLVSQTTRGFTGEEELSVAGLVHLNGRVYDPLIARMLSADPVVPDALNAQAWNRYSYVGNDPLAFTDPSGFSWLSQFFHRVEHFLQAHPLIRSIVQIAITAALLVALPAAGFTGAALVGAAAAGGSAITTGLSGGHLGDILRNAVIAGATAVA